MPLCLQDSQKRCTKAFTHAAHQVQQLQQLSSSPLLLVVAQHSPRALLATFRGPFVAWQQLEATLCQEARMTSCTYMT
jgi:hypothetical protein